MKNKELIEEKLNELIHLMGFERKNIASIVGQTLTNTTSLLCGEKYYLHISFTTTSPKPKPKPKSVRAVYQQLFDSAYGDFITGDILGYDKARRLAAIHAVENTARVWRSQ